MAELRVERKSGGRTWLWVLVAVVVLIVGAVLLDRAGYIELPVNLGAASAEPASVAHIEAAAVGPQGGA